MRSLAVVVLLIASTWPAAASAPPPEQLFRQFGLFGTWASDCQAAASPSNPHVEIGEPTPGVVLEDDRLGRDYALNRYSVLAARRLSSTRLEVVALFHPGMENEERQRLIFEIRGRTRRTLFTEVVGGPVRVRDGIALANGSKTPLLKKCE
jgi:hypothetical protein